MSVSGDWPAHDLAAEAVPAAQSFSIGAAVDLMAGAIDVPPAVGSATTRFEGRRLDDCEHNAAQVRGYGPHVTETDKVRNVTVNIGGTFVLALVWLALVWVWKHWQFRATST